MRIRLILDRMINCTNFFKAAKKVASGKWSVGAVGYLANVPYVNEL